LTGVKTLKHSLYAQVLVGIVLGLLLGVVFPGIATELRPLGDGFIKLIKMLIGPIIFCTVVTGIAGADDIKQIGRTGGLALLYFEIMSTVALATGLVIVNLVRPGAGMNVDPSSLDAAAVGVYSGPGKLQSATQFLLNVIPTTFFDAFARGEILQILLLAVLFGLALQAARPRSTAVFGVIEATGEVFFGMLRIVMRLAPIGALGAVAFTIGRYGIGSLVPLAKLMASFYGCCVLFVGLGLGAVARLHGFSIGRFLLYFKEELLIVLGTSASETVLPRMMVKLERLGAAKSVVGLVIPAGYSFNLDGTSIYLSMAAVFIAQATNTPLSLPQQVVLLGVLVLTSKGAAGVTGSGFIVLAATLSSVSSVPVAGLALILGIDRFMSEARALTNLIGNGVATLVVARWMGKLDTATLKVELRAPASSTGRMQTAKETIR
jgi:aerobic C4-dicarboxylate transport protein